LIEKTGWNFKGGLMEGKHFPKGKYDNKPLLI